MSFRIKTIALLSSVTFAWLLALMGLAHAQMSGAWVSGSGQGYTAYGTQSGTSFVRISCDMGASANHSRTSISIEIDGQLLPEDSIVEFRIDGSTLAFPSNNAGGVTPSKCPGCVNRFRELWAQLRAGRQLQVVASDDRRATFSLKGTASLLPPEACATGPEFVQLPSREEQTAELAPATPEPPDVALSAPQSCGVIEPDPQYLEAAGVSQARDLARSRVALVVGMAGYRNGVPALRNPINDIHAVSNSLLRLGFTVYYASDAGGQALAECARRVRAAHPDPATTLFYYAGHGIQIDDENYLVTVDADVELGAKVGLVPVNEVIEWLRPETGAFLIFLDACRSNPFFEDGRDGLSASTGRGATAIKGDAVDVESGNVQAHGMLVSYSTSPNAVAQDGDGELSPFADALVQHITTPGRSIQAVMSTVSEAVGEATDWSQTPWTRSSLTDELKLAGPMTVEEAQAASENWARRSREFLERGRRLEAIAAALKGIPADQSADHANREYPLASNALWNAYLSGNAVAQPDIASIEGRFHHGFWMSPDRDRYVFAHGAEEVYFSLHRASDGELVAMLMDSFRSDNFLTMVTFSRDGSRVAAVFDNGLTAWSTDDGSLIARAVSVALPVPGGNFAFSPGNARLMADKMYGSSEASIVDADTGETHAHLTEAGLSEGSPELGRFLADQEHGSKMKITFMDDRTLCVAVAGSMTRRSTLPMAMGTFDLKTGTYTLSGTFAAENASFVQGVYCSPDRRWAAVAVAQEGDPTTLHIWDFQTGRVHAQIATDNDGARSAFDPDSRFLSIVKGGAAVYDLEKQRLLDHTIGSASAIRPSLFAPDGKGITSDTDRTPHYFWALLSDTSKVIAPAGAAIGDDLRQEVDAERIELWRVGNQQ